MAGRVAELERYAPHTKPAVPWQSYRWLYDVIGEVHRIWGDEGDLGLPRPLGATYGPPATVRLLTQLYAARGHQRMGPRPP